MNQETPQPKDRLFIGVYPGGIVYADRGREEHGDYARLAFLPFDTLKLDIASNCPLDLKERIEADASRIQLQRGKQFRISTAGQTVMLGAS